MGLYIGVTRTCRIRHFDEGVADLSVIPAEAGIEFLDR
jgi:hypothetical protein